MEIKQKRYFLVVENTVFVDPHGSPDHGGTKTYVVNNPNYLDYDGHYVSGGEIIEYEDLQGSMDGYNSTYESYSVWEITKEQAQEWERIKKLESDFLIAIKLLPFKEKDNE